MSNPMYPSKSALPEAVEGLASAVHIHCRPDMSIPQTALQRSATKKVVINRPLILLCCHFDFSPPKFWRDHQ